MLFDEIVELYARTETPRKVPEEKPSGRTLDELLQSRIWKLELTCSPIKETPEKVAPEEPRLFGRHVSRQFFSEDDRENQAPTNRPQGSRHLARLAPGRRIKLIVLQVAEFVLKSAIVSSKKNTWFHLKKWICPSRSFSASTDNKKGWSTRKTNSADCSLATLNIT